MALTLEAAERLFRLGEYQALLNQTDHSKGGLRSLPPEQRLLIAHALALTGKLREAEHVANSLNGINLPRAKAIVEMTFGMVAAARGKTAQAIDHFRSGLAVARDAKDLESAAWLHARLFRFMIEAHPTDELLVLLGEARRSVLQAGDPHVSAYLHICVAVLEGQLGRTREALRHCEIAESLTRSFPNAWLEMGNLFNRGCIAVVDGDLPEAIRFLKASRQLAAKSTQDLGEARVDHALGHIHVLRGAFELASDLLSATLASKAIPHLTRLASLDGLARLYLSQGRLAECDQMLSGLDEASTSTDTSRSNYHLRWAAITRARLFLKQGQPEEALAHLHRAASEASGAKDVPFDCALQITAAQAHVRRQRHAEAAQCLAAATRLGVTGFRELLGAYYQAAAETTVDDGVADVLRNRASRVWSTQGIVSVPLEMQSPLPDRRLQAPAPAASPLTVIERLAGAVDLAYSPALIGDELLAVLEALGVADARLVERPATAAPLSTDRQLVMPLGPARRTNGHVYLTCSLPADSARALAVTNVLRIGATAVEAERARQEQRERTALWPADPLEGEVNGLFIAEEMQTLLAMARKIAGTTVAVLITGETGTGKEVLARAIHAYSSRSKQLFLPFNCASMPKEMLDSQLFGHRRGAFTGAAEHFPGVIRAASGGTLFLDEIGDLGLDVQPKLLRFLESGEVHPIGEAQPVSTNVRVIAATNVELESLVSSGRFREDLFYRLNIVRLHVPPLRERRVEIPALAHHYLQRYGREWGKGDLRLSEETIEYLTLYRWPGNVRQLANEMRRIAVIAEPGAVLTPQCLSPDVLAARRTVPASERTLEPCEMVVRLDQPMTAATEQVERAMLEFALRKCQGRMEDTAAMLGLSRKGLYLKRHRFGIESPAPALSADGR